LSRNGSLAFALCAVSWVLATFGASDFRSNPMALNVSQLSVLTAYLAIAFVGAIVLGVF